MKTGAMFPSRYVKEADLQGKHIRVKIQSVQMEAVGQDESEKPVVYFQGKKKGLCLNKINASMIEEISGSDDTDNWAGVEIVLYPSRTEYQGKRVPCIRVAPPDEPKLKNGTRPAAPNMDADPVPDGAFAGEPTDEAADPF